MKEYNISVLPGDGIGPEIMTQALDVLKGIADKYHFSFKTREGLIGGAAYDSFQTPLPEETITMCKNSDAVLLGSIGGPKWDTLPPKLKPELGGLLGIRKALKLNANIRPILLFEEIKELSPLAPGLLKKKIDLVTVRELASGIYFGQPKELSATEGVDTMRYKKTEVESIARVAFELAGKRRKKVTSVDKANVLYSSMLWRKTVSEMGKSYPDIDLEFMYVDNAAMQLILNPGEFDVILTTNLFGDILTDESAALCGSLGMLPSASLGDKVNLYEPAGGSAPDIAGEGIANPIAQILSVALMLDYSFQLPNAARDIYGAVEEALKKGARTKDIAGEESEFISTAEMGTEICRILQDSPSLE